MAISAEYRSTFVAFIGNGDVSKWLKNSQTDQIFLCLDFLDEKYSNKKEIPQKWKTAKIVAFLPQLKPFTAKYSLFKTIILYNAFQDLCIRCEYLFCYFFLKKSILRRFHQK